MYDRVTRDCYIQVGDFSGLFWNFFDLMRVERGGGLERGKGVCPCILLPFLPPSWSHHHRLHVNVIFLNIFRLSHGGGVGFELLFSFAHWHTRIQIHIRANTLIHLERERDREIRAR